MILSAQQLSIHFGMRPILQQADFYLEDHDKVGIVGLNGAGKALCCACSPVRKRRTQAK